MLKNLLVFLYKIKFFKRIIPSLLRKFNFIYLNHIFHIENFKIKLDLKNSLERKIFLEGSFEPEQTSFLKDNIKNIKFNYFIDIGSYIGYYTLFFSSFSNIDKIISIEANSINYNYLLDNISLNNLNNVYTYNLGCSNRDENAKLWFSNTNKMGGSSILDEQDFEYKKYNLNPFLNNDHLKKHYNKSIKDYKKTNSDFIYHNIKTKKLDNLLKVKNKTLLIKIDVERHEHSVLVGSENILNNNKIFLQIEIFPELFKKINLFLEEKNFKLIKNIGWDYYYKNF